MYAKVLVKLRNYSNALAVLNKLNDISRGVLKKAFCFYHLGDFKNVVKILDPIPNLKDLKTKYRQILA